MLSINGDKADVVVALYKKARSTGAGECKETVSVEGVDVERTIYAPPALTRNEAAQLVIGSGGKFEAVNFVPLSVDLTGDEFDPENFDALYGDGAAEEALTAAGIV